MPSALPDTTALHPTGASCERREALECGSLLPLFSASLLAVSRVASRNRVAFAGRHLIEVQNGDALEGRRPGNVIAQTKRGTSAGLGHAAAINQPCKGGIELNGRGYFAPAGLVRSPAGTQGCARSLADPGLLHCRAFGPQFGPAFNHARFRVGVAFAAEGRLSYAAPAGWLGEGGSRLPHSTARCAPCTAATAFP